MSRPECGRRPFGKYDYSAPRSQSGLRSLVCQRCFPGVITLGVAPALHLSPPPTMPQNPSLRCTLFIQACREEGLLGLSGLVRVRARGMKTHELERYTLDRCSLQAKFLFAVKPSTTVVVPGASEDPADGPRTPEGEEEARGAMVLPRRREDGAEDIQQLLGKCSVQKSDEAPNERGSGASVGEEEASSGRLNSGMRGGITSGSSSSRSCRSGCGAGQGGQQCVVLAGGEVEGECDREEATRKQERSRKGRRRKSAARGADT